uniref:Uncharacterized protein n=1 Tax=uncultured prokaryote TaxID=198431 RepID=A0A0H5Q4N1_9ZZZZ|nr:hypothetical protein [uncultured prokaryote]
MQELIIIALKAFTVLSAGVAALLWVRAAQAEVAPMPGETRVSLGLGDREIDLNRTMALQSKRNVCAAKATAAAFLFQAAQYTAENWPF